MKVKRTVPRFRNNGITNAGMGSLSRIAGIHREESGTPGFFPLRQMMRAAVMNAGSSKSQVSYEAIIGVNDEI